jgi:hypothetical protein
MRCWFKEQFIDERIVVGVHACPDSQELPWRLISKWVERPFQSSLI